MLTCLALVACTERVQLGRDDTIPGLVALEIEPSQTMLAVDDLGSPKQIVDLVATGTFIDGTRREVTELVTWGTDNPYPGGFARPGSYTTSNEAGGHVVVSASNGEVVGTAAVTVVVTTAVVDNAFPPPANVDELFAAGTPVVAGNPMRSPAVQYPNQGTLFPQGLARILFQYTRGMNDAFRLRFDSDVLHLTVLTGSDRWQPDEAVWQLIARSHPGSMATLEIAAAASATPGTIYTPAAPTELHFARTVADGVVYYFSDATDGVSRAQLGSATSAVLYPPSGSPQCAGCHAVSRDGRTMAFGLGGEKLGTLDLVSLEPGLTPAANIPMGWAAFSPDNTRVLVAHKGKLTLRDAATGTPVGPANGVIPLPADGTHPDWSPDGSAIAITLAPMGDNNMDLRGGSIATLAYSDGAWGVPQVLVTSTGDNDNNFFPKWSPDGRFLAYVHADGPSRHARSAELRMIGATGGTPLALAIASHRVAANDGVPDLATTMPSWGPANGDLAWLTFASERPYGTVRPMGGSQIWIAGIDLSRAGTSDPSFAAFWLPAQDVTALGNNPIWAPSPRATEVTRP
jgi:hypothetical protein